MTLTIGLPVYNCERTLEVAVQSIFAQSVRDWELILIDDGSTDGSLEIARSISDARVRVISDGKNRGLVYRLNQISYMAEGTYIARMDGDDIMHPERLEAQVMFLEQNSDVDVVGTATFTIDADNRPMGKRATGRFDPSATSILRAGLFVHPTVVGRREWFLENPYDPAFIRAEDRELWVRTSARSRFARISEPLFYYRETDKINIASYLQSCRTDQMIFRKHAPDIIGTIETQSLVLRSKLKALVYITLGNLGMGSKLLRSRNSPLNTSEVQTQMEVIKRILQTPVPGWID